MVLTTELGRTGRILRRFRIGEELLHFGGALQRLGHSVAKVIQHTGMEFVISVTADRRPLRLGISRSLPTPPVADPSADCGYHRKIHDTR